MSSHLITSLFVVMVCLVHTAWTVQWTLPPRYTAKLLPAEPNGQYVPGMEVRLRIQAYSGDATGTPAKYNLFNVTAGAMQLRVIAAYPNRGATGQLQSCNSTASLVWHEARDVGVRSYRYANVLSEVGSTTFVVPPFPFRVCFKYTPDRLVFNVSTAAERSWREVNNLQHRVFSVNVTDMFWHGSSTMVQGDYAAIYVQRFTSLVDFGITVPRSDSVGTGDSVKLVPAGFPCSYEKTTSTDSNSSALQYCGSNQVEFATGRWINTDCIREGAVVAGRVGTNTLNPLVDVMTSGFPRPLQPSEKLVAYVRLPEPGMYDVCYSASKYRARMARRWYDVNKEAVPVWFKLFKASAKDGCSDLSTPLTRRYCVPREMRLQVVASAPTADAVSWGMWDTTTLSWGPMKFEGSNLSSARAASWDPRTNRTKEYYSTVGGDMFRLVRRPHLRANPSTPSELVGLRVHVASIGTSFGAGTYTQLTGMSPGYGPFVEDGCWFSAKDNYGSFGNGVEESCDTCDTFGGVSASGDLGGRPNSSTAPWLEDSTAQTDVYAYIRVPLDGEWVVCYRRPGIQNWRAIPRSTTSPVVGPSYLPPSPPLNLTYKLNDTRADTWAQIEVRSHRPEFNTLPRDSTSFIGSEMKIVMDNEDCFRHIGVSVDTDPGLPECDIAHCILTKTCDVGRVCTGSADDASVMQRAIYFHLRIPPYLRQSSRHYKICFRTNSSNWHQLPQHDIDGSVMTNVLRFRPQPPPRIRYILNDARAGAWGKLLIASGTDRATDRLDSRARTPFGEGTVLHLVPNVTSNNAPIRCDVVWGGLTSHTQHFNAALTVSDLGVWCNETSHQTGQCAAAITHPEQGGIVGTYPYTDINRKGDASKSHNAVAFLTIPTDSLAGKFGYTVGYRVCLRQMNRNWIELQPGGMAVSPARSYSLDVSHHSTLYAGMYGYIKITAKPGTPQINLNESIVKLVQSDMQCEGPAAGTQSHTNRFVSFTIANQRGSFLVDNANISRTTGATSAARAYFVFPTLASAAAASTSYKVCIGTRTATMNWDLVGSVSVVSLGITYHVEAEDLPLYNGGVIRVKFMSHSPTTKFSTMPNADAAKLIAIDSVCVPSNGALPGVLNTTSVHVGEELSDAMTKVSTISQSIFVRSAGVTDLGPGDDLRSNTASMRLTLPRVSGEKRYKVCLKPHGSVWMEIEVLNSRVEDARSGIVTRDSGLSTFTIAAELLAQDPTSSLRLYHGVYYTAAVPAGVSTVLDATTYDSTTTTVATYGLTVTGTSSLSTYDELKLVQVEDETRPGLWEKVFDASCQSPVATARPIAVVATSASFAVNMPQRPGRYVLCYRRRGVEPWVVMTNSNSTVSNPFVVLDSLLRVQSTTTTVGILDKFTIGSVTKGSVSADDRVYLVPLNGVCGHTPSYHSASTSILQSSVKLSGSFGAFTSLSTAANPGAWYPIPTTTNHSSVRLCYLKVWSNVTTGASTTERPFLRGYRWYMLPDVVTRSKPYALRATCSYVNATYAASPGEVLSYKVQVVDEKNNVLPDFGEKYAYEIEAVPNNIAIRNSGGMCRAEKAAPFGWSSVTNTREYTERATGFVEFLIVPLSLCTASPCEITFKSDGLLDSNACPISVYKSVVNNLEVVVKQSTCQLEQPCNFEVVAYTINGNVAYTTSETATVVMSQHAGMGFQINGDLVDATSTYTGSSFSAGKVQLSVVIFGSDASIFQSNYTVTLAVSVNGKIVATTFSVFKPYLSKVNILDLYPVDWDGMPYDNDVLNKVPSWEPLSTYLQSYWKPSTGLSSLGTSPFYLMAGQYYRVTLEARDQFDRLFSDINFLSQAERSISVDFVTPINKNQLIGLPSDADGIHAFEGVVPVVPFTASTGSIAFRVKNSLGCSRSSGCRIEFKFGGKSPALTSTYIETPVRPLATKLLVSCGVGGQVPPYTLSTTCPISSVETGFTVQVIAQDENGVVDEFNSGLVHIFMKDGNGVVNSRGIGVTSVSKLLQDDTSALATLQMSRGVAVTTDLTTTQPCGTGNCTIQLVSSWGGLIAELALPVSASTEKLDCQVDSSQKLFVMSTDHSRVESTLDVTRTSDFPHVLVYPKLTPMCFQVRASSASGVRTLYERNWVMMFIQSTDGVTAVDYTASSVAGGRVKAMQRSRTQFCVVLHGIEGATFGVNFVAQRFTSKTYWANSAGTCSLGTFRITTTRFAAGLQLRTVGGFENAITGFGAPSSHVWLWRQLKDLSEEVNVNATFDVKDHYGNVVPTAELTPSHQRMYITISKCMPSTVNSGACAAGSGVESESMVHVGTSLSMVESGMLSVAIGSYQNTLLSGSTPTFGLRVGGFCLYCTLTFSIATESAAFSDAIVGQITATLGLSVIVPADLPRYVVFKSGTSPIKPTSETFAGFAATPWRHWLKPSGNGVGDIQPTTKPIVFATECMNNSLCRHREALYMTSTCDETGSADTLSFDVYVVASKVAPTFGEVACASTCTTGKSVLQSQVDIFSNFTLGVSVGNQVLQCTSSAPCVDDLSTNIKLATGRLGTSIEAALLKVRTAKSLSSAQFSFQGTTSSSYYGSLSNGPLSTPSVKGYLKVDATTIASAVPAEAAIAATSLSLETIGSRDFLGKYEFIWRGPRQVQKLTFRDSAKEPLCRYRASTNVPTYTKTILRTSSSYTGYRSMGHTLSSLSVNYTSFDVPIDVYIPFTVDVVDSIGVRSLGAQGSITLSKDSWVGCNNGGTMTVKGGATQDLVDGRVTFWTKFSAPCQSCRLRAVVNPDFSQAHYANLGPTDPNLVAVSRTFVVRGALKATNVYSLSDNQKQAATLSVDDVVSVTLQAVAELDEYTMNHPTAPFTAKAYNRIQNVDMIEFYGNGGILRANTGSVNLNDRHAVSIDVNSQGTLGFTFQRTCSSCSAVIVWSIPSTGAEGSFLVRNLQGTAFVVRATSGRNVLVGWVPRMVHYGTYFAAAQWNMGTSPSFKGVIGRGQSTVSFASASKSVANAKNGDGGVLETLTLAPSSTLAQAASVAFRLMFPLPCYTCRLTFAGGSTHDMTIVTTATHLRVTSINPPSVLPNTDTYISLFASDELGYMDIRVGGVTQCRFNLPFQCLALTTKLEIYASGDGKTVGAFSPTRSYFHVGGPSLSSNWALTTQTNFVLVDGETPPGGLRIRFSHPARNVLPILTEFFSRLATRDTTISVDVELDTPTSALSLSVSEPATDAYIYTPVKMEVAFVGKTNGLTQNIVSTKGNNKVSVTFGGACSLDMSRTTTSARMVRGIATFNFYFTQETSFVMCRLTFLADPTSGAVVCKDTKCVAQSEVRVVSLVATSWSWKRPSTSDSWGTPAPLYAAQGRKMYVEVQLYLVNPTTQQNDIARRCNTYGTACSFAVVPQSCSPAPIITPATAQFDSFGKAKIILDWRESTDRLAYSCLLATRVTGATLEAPLNLASSTVTVCSPSRVVLVTNITNDPAWTATPILQTGRLYPLLLRSVDASGAHCRGDSQDEGTLLTLDLLTCNGVGKAFTGVKVFNANMTQTSSVVSAAPLSNSIRMVGGEFRLLVAFTGSTRDLKIPGVRVQITASSTSPLINQVITTPPIETTSIASRVRVSPDTPIPRYIMRTVPIKATVQVVDAIQDDWEKIAGKANVIPNYPVKIQWRLQPALPHEQPFRFVQGTMIQEMPLSGHSDFEWYWNFADGEYVVYVEDFKHNLNQSYSYPVTAQTPISFALHTQGYRVGSPDFCKSSPCMLPNGTFGTKLIMYEGRQMQVLNISTSSQFSFNFSIHDSLSRAVRADVVSVVQVRLVPLTNESITAVLAEPPSLLVQGPRRLHIAEGTVLGSVGFLGTTQMNNGSHVPVVLEFLCDPTTAVYCGGLSALRSEPFIIEGFPSTPEITTAFRTLRPIVKIPTTLSSLSDFDESSFAVQMALYLNKQGITYIAVGNANSVLRFTVCEVVRSLFSNADLRDTVCGTGNVCTTLGDEKCPQGVRRCKCPSSSRTAFFRRLLQTTASVTPTPTTTPATLAPTTTATPTPTPGVTTEVQAEMAVLLENAVGFKPSSAAVIASELQTLSSAVLVGLRTSATFSAFQVQTDLVTNTTSGTPVEKPPATPPPTTPPPTPAPPQGTTNSTTSDSPAVAMPSFMSMYAVLWLCSTLMLMATL